MGSFRIPKSCSVFRLQQTLPSLRRSRSQTGSPPPTLLDVTSSTSLCALLSSWALSSLPLMLCPPKKPCSKQFPSVQRVLLLCSFPCQNSPSSAASEASGAAFKLGTPCDSSHLYLWLSKCFTQILPTSSSTQGHRRVKDPGFKQQDRAEPRREGNASTSEQKEQPGMGQAGYSALKLHAVPVSDTPHCLTEIQVNLLSPEPGVHQG